jgi:putative ABC transport system permease protein
MKTYDIIRAGASNLWHTKLRAILTILGVVIGIAALTSLVSFGTGLQKNLSDAFTRNDLFTSLRVSPISVDDIQPRNQSTNPVNDTASAILNEETIDKIRKIPGVEIVFPEQRFAANAIFNKKENKVYISVLPLQMGKYSPYNDLEAGKFFESDTSFSAVVSTVFLKSAGIMVGDKRFLPVMTKKDSATGFRVLPYDSIIGREITITTATFGIPGAFPFQRKSTKLKITGIAKPDSPFGNNFFSSNIIIPGGIADKIPRIDFNSVWDIIDKKNDEKSFASVYVRLSDIRYLKPVQEKIKRMGFSTYSFSDQLKEIRRGFLIVNSILGAVGTIALIVAALGIINTMLMSVIERTREIGIMKAVGGGEHEIRRIFFFEAGIIGFIGAVFGLLTGWGVTKIANFIINMQLKLARESPVDMFYFPLWLILGATAFSILISIISGMYPAIRASRIDPVKALRHD